MIWFFLSISFLLIIRLEKFNSLAVFLYVSIVAVHTFIAQFLQPSAGFTYFLSAALADFFVIASLYSIKNKTLLILQLQKLCFAFININLFGYMLYDQYYEPVLYNILCYALYILAIAAIYKDGSNELAINRIDSVLRSVFGINRKGSRSMPKDRGKEL